MSDRRIRILYAEDADVDRTAFERSVRAQDLQYDYTLACSYQEALAELRRSSFDAIISDYQLGDGTALDVLEQAGHTPVIVVTGAGREEIAVQAIKQGASDYLVKDRDLNYLKVLPLTVENALAYRAAQQALHESEARFRIMADTAPVMIWMAAPDKLSTYFNKTWLDSTGRPLETELGEGWLAGVHPDDLERWRETYVAAFEAREPFRIEFRLRRFDGNYGWVLNTGTPRLTIERGFLGYIGSCIDITERKELESRQQQLLSQIERSHEGLLSILDQLSLGVALIDEHGHVTFVNQACQQLTGKKRKAIVGAPWERALPMSTEHKGLLRETMRRRREHRERLSLGVDGADGQRYAVDIEIQDDPRNAARKIVFMHDMTALHDLRLLLQDKATAHGIVGRSAPMQTVYEQINVLSKLDTTVLIEGDTGTGKELVAKAVHDGGHRKDMSFIALNCAGLTESLLASQLFGHRRGAFTGAIEDHRGHFEAANGGTLFLDEIGDISPSVQTSLLRVLQEREIVRIGESTPRKVDVRIIAATHRNLNQEVKVGRFRADLLYRIRVARITLPPLRDRCVDIPLLVASFLRRFRATTGKGVENVSHEAMRVLMDYDWPGNVRELQSAIEFAAIRCRGSIIDAIDLPPETLVGPDADHPTPNGLVDEKDRILAALNKANGNRTRAAQMLDMSRATLYRRLAELNIESV